MINKIFKELKDQLTEHFMTGCEQSCATIYEQFYRQVSNITVWPDDVETQLTEFKSLLKQTTQAQATRLKLQGMLKVYDQLTKLELMMTEAKAA